jgi:NADH dehydrogenase
MRQLMELLLAQIERRRFLIPVPAPIAGLLGQVGDLIALSPFTPPITSDQAKLLSVDNVVSPGALGLADLGVEPTGLEPVLGTYLYRFRKGGQYADLTEMPAVG